MACRGCLPAWLPRGDCGHPDGHKGWPGASYPGAALFGAVGGLTCFLTNTLTRDGILDCIRKRHHYATTGGEHGRPLITVTAHFSRMEPHIMMTLRHGRDDGYAIRLAQMEIFICRKVMPLAVDIRTSTPIERVDIFNVERVETIRPFKTEELGSRIRVIWEGAEYRGRFRQVIWDGSAFYRTR